MIKKAYPSGLMYLCQTKQDPYSYKGSGTRWTNHIKHHNSHIITCIIGEYETMEELREAGIQYSRELNVVESEEWANLREEDGTGGGSGKVGRRWKIKDTSKMRGPKTKTDLVVSGYRRITGMSNYQCKGWYITPWGAFAGLSEAVKTAKEIRASDPLADVLTDGATIKRYCVRADEPLSFAVRVPKSKRGKRPSEMGYGFKHIENSL